MWKCISKVEQVGDGHTWVRLQFELVGKGMTGVANLTMDGPACHYVEGAEYAILEPDARPRVEPSAPIDDEPTLAVRSHHKAKVK